MTQKASIKLVSPDYKKLQEVCSEIKDIAKRSGAKVSGPVPLPTKKLTVPTLKVPGGGMGTKTWEKWQMRVHKRLLTIEADERTLRQIMRVQLPDEVHIEIELKSE